MKKQQPKFDFKVMAALPSSCSEERPFSYPLAPTKWEILHRKVIYGKITPETAERRIRSWGVKFKVSPAFPTMPVAWNVEMVAAWIATENMAHVLRHHPDAWGRSRAWVENDHAFSVKLDKSIPLFLLDKKNGDNRGHDLKTLERVPLGKPYRCFEGTLVQPGPVNWDAELREKLIEGRITAIGFDRNISPTDIPKRVWLEATFVDCGKTTGIAVRGNTIFEEVAFLRSEIVSEIKIKYVAPGVTDGIVGYRPWRQDVKAEDLTLRGAVLLNFMTKIYREGFPIFVSNKVRHAAVTTELHRHKIDNWVGNQESFDRYMTAFRKKVSLNVEPVQE